MPIIPTPTGRGIAIPHLAAGWHPRSAVNGPSGNPRACADSGAATRLGRKMAVFNYLRSCLLISVLTASLLPDHVSAQSGTDMPKSNELRDGQHDFDFEI